MKNYQGTVLLLTTGGTIDKIHDPYLEEIVFDEHSYMPELLQESRVQQVEVKGLYLKDSLHTTDEDRQKIAEYLNKATQFKSIVITHGTSTMVDTARYLNQNLENKEQSIVLTGSFRPYTLRKSDAQFNVGSAVAAARLADPGIHILMHGMIFSPDEVEKNPEILQFKKVEKGG